MASANSLFLPKRMADAYFSGTFKMLLVSAVPSETELDTFDFRNDVVTEVAASGTYATGGATVTCSVGAVDTTNNRVAVTFGNPAAGLARPSAQSADGSTSQSALLPLTSWSPSWTSAAPLPARPAASLSRCPLRSTSTAR